MAGRDQLTELYCRSFGGDLGGHDHIDAVRPSTGFVVHPAQHLVQFGGVMEPDAAEHAETASPADGRGDVLRRSEPDNRVLDPELVTDRRSHPGLLRLTCG